MAAPGAEAGREPPDEPLPMFTGPHGVGARYAGRVGRHAAAYGVAAGATVVGGLANVVVFTRFLDPAEFGKMAVLSVLATVIALLATLGVMQGTMRRIYGTTADDEVGEIDPSEDKSVTSDPRLALSTGLALTLGLGAVCFLAVVALQGAVDDLLGGEQNATLLILAAAAGVAGAVMRFSRNILRLQLRSAAYLVVTLVYSFAGIPVAVALLADGLGIEAVLIGFIAANALAAAICLLLLLADLRPAVSLREARAIMGGGLRYLPIVLSFQAIQLGDTLLVAGFDNFSETGLYRVAQRIAVPVSYGTSVFQQAWGPMRRDLTQAAVDRLDRERAYTAHLFTYYAVFVTALILTVAVLADQLVRLAAGEFGEAATLVPLTALSVAGHGWFVLAYRAARLPGQMGWMIGLSLLAALGFVVLSALLIPAYGAIGAPLAAIAAWGTVTFVMLAANQLRGEPIPFEYRHLLTLAGLTLGVWLLSEWLLPETLFGVAGRVALLLAWGAALPATGVVPMREARALARYARDAAGIDSRRQLRARIAALEGPDAVLVEELVRRCRPPQEVAERAGMSEDEVLAGAVQALRRAGGGGDPQPTDAELGGFLFLPRPRAESDIGLMSMVVRGADPLDADLVKRAAAAARSRRGRRSGR